jgi:hypothetical protein
MCCPLHCGVLPALSPPPPPVQPGMTILTEKPYKVPGELPGRLFKVTSRRNGVDTVSATLVLVLRVDAAAGPPGCFGVIETFTTTAEVRLRDAVAFVGVALVCCCCCLENRQAPAITVRLQL